MKKDLMQRVASVINALNNITVKGEENLANLSGSITVLKETLSMLSAANFVEETKSESVEEVK